jgi:protein-disulfide isomerase
MNIQRRLIAATVSCLLAFLCSAAASAQTADRGRAPFGDEALQKVIHDYILAHPEVLIESLQIARERQQIRQEQQSKNLISSLKKELVDDPMTPVRGNPSGDVTLIEFFDYRCPYCRQVEPWLQTLINNNSSLRVVEKEMPILGAASVYEARTALAALKQGKHEAFHNAIMSKKPNVDDATILQLVAQAGLDLDRMKTDMNSPEVDAEIKRTLEIAKVLKLNGTPAFIVGSELVPGATDLETLQALVDEARHGTN